mmetsp:Transcript_4961/g.8250  ORF Transcript_4961/g.8250 Transcript_4961/m.8250 type:complete len:84 (-) Transcript_4961:735-986(-)
MCTFCIYIKFISELNSSSLLAWLHTGLEGLTLDYKAEWPMSLVVSRKALPHKISAPLPPPIPLQTRGAPAVCHVAGPPIRKAP